VGGCTDKHFARGWCRKHYARWKRNGDLALRHVNVGLCSVDECERPAERRKMCRPHYRRWMKYGDATTPTPAPKREDPCARWLAKVQKTDDCWLWTGAKTHGGYGSFWSGDRLVLAHRWSYEHFVGPIGDTILDHLCRVRSCVRPDHLEPVSARENLMRGNTAAARNAAKTHCPQGHPYDEVNTYRDKRGRRSCNACRRAAVARYEQRLRGEQL
jgi:hypothetical protein